LISHGSSEIKKKLLILSIIINTVVWL